MKESELTFEELREIHEIDNSGGDCDCSFCREYRRLVKERDERATLSQEP